MPPADATARSGYVQLAVREPSGTHRPVLPGRVGRSSMGEWLRQLRQRKLMQWALGYLAAGWLFLEVSGFLASSFAWPDAVVRTLVVVVGVGFGAALVVGWNHGERGRQKVGAGEFAALLALVLTGVLLARLTWRAAPPVTVAGPATQAPAVFHDAATEMGSLAVLPFAYPEGDTLSHYFGDGLTEELIYALARVEGLRVASRTSSFATRGAREDVRAIAARLGVGAILEGSVRRSGDRIRVTTQLTDARTGYALWTEGFERPVEGVFTLQSEIAAAVARALNPDFDEAGLGPVAGRTTASAVAYDAFLKGRFLWNQRTDDEIRRSLDFFRAAAAADPSYAAAYSGQADAWLTMFDYGLVSYDEAEAAAGEAARRALSLDERLADAHASLGHLALHEWRWQEAQEELLRAIRLDPSYTTAYHWYALALTSVGRAEEAVAAMEAAAKLDPLSLRISADVGMAYHAAGRYRDALDQEQKVLAVNPSHATAHFIRGIAFEQMNEPDSAEAALRAALASAPADANFMGALGHVLAQSGSVSEALVIAEELDARDRTGEDAAFFATLIRTALGDVDRAFEGLTRSVERRSGSVRYLKIEPRLDPLRSDPRYRPLLRAVGLPY